MRTTCTQKQKCKVTHHLNTIGSDKDTAKLFCFLLGGILGVFLNLPRSSAISQLLNYKSHYLQRQEINFALHVFYSSARSIVCVLITCFSHLNALTHKLNHKLTQCSCLFYQLGSSWLPCTSVQVSRTRPITPNALAEATRCHLGMAFCDF